MGKRDSYPRWLILLFVATGALALLMAIAKDHPLAVGLGLGIPATIATFVFVKFRVLKQGYWDFRQDQHKEKRRTISQTEWDVIKRQYGFKCALCGRTETTVSILEKAHIKAFSKGGFQYMPMCRNCHWKYDHNDLTDIELGKLGLTRETYDRFRPR